MSWTRALSTIYIELVDELTAEEEVLSRARSTQLDMYRGGEERGREEENRSVGAAN